jgi:hypothetical protein
MELNKLDILGLSLKDLYLELESIKQQVLGIHIILEDNNQIIDKNIDFELRSKIYAKVKLGYNISIHIIDIITNKYTEKWKNRKVYFGDYNHRMECDYYKFQDEIIKRKALMVNVINAYYNYKEKNYQ